jgi:hypothetical protein
MLDVTVCWTSPYAGRRWMLDVLYAGCCRTLAVAWVAWAAWSVNMKLFDWTESALSDGETRDSNSDSKLLLGRI